MVLSGLEAEISAIIISGVAMTLMGQTLGHALTVPNVMLVS